ncbi:MAG: DUF1349 domain-containing protein [Pontimonas sp.]
METVAWESGEWVNEPPQWNVESDSLIVYTALESDLWRTTSYGFVHDTGHGLLAPLADGRAMELTIAAEYSQSFDQAGMLVWSDKEHWVKCGIELSDGVLGIGAVVTNEHSDWSTAPVSELDDGPLQLRISRSGDALTIRWRVGDIPWRLLRLAPINPDAAWKAGPYAASPTREGLEVHFSDWREGAADSSLH